MIKFGPVDAARIAALLVPFLPPPALSDAQLAQLSAYLDLLLRWNARINLTAVHAPEEVVTRHFGESLFAARCIFGALPTVRPSCLSQHSEKFPPTAPPLWGDLLCAFEVIDLGSGAGFPGLPIKIYAPEIHLTLIESQHKKATFLREVVRALTLTGVNVFSGRAEDFQKSGGNAADLVTLRAVEKFTAVLPAATAMLKEKPAGRIALLIGARQVEGAENLLPCLRWDVPAPVPHSAARVVLIGTNQPR